MNTKQKIPIESYRTFGDFIGDGFKFVFRNRKHFLQGLFIYVLPLFLLGSVALYFFAGSTFDSMMGMPGDNLDPFENLASMGFGMLVYYIITFFTYFAVLIVTYSIVLAYKESPDGEFDFEAVQKHIKSNFANMITTYLLVIVGLILFALVTVGLCVSAGSINVFLAVIIGIGAFIAFAWLGVNLQFPFIVTMDKKLTAFASIRKAFELVKGNWWNIFLLMFVMSLLVSMISYIFILPAYILMIVKMVTAFDDPSASGLGFVGSLYMISILLGTIVASTFYLTTMALKYYSIVEQKEGGSLLKRINQLGEKEEGLFENEGDF